MERITAKQSPSIYDATEEDDGTAIIWVRLSIAKGLAQTIDGKSYYLGEEGFTSWGFHSRQPNIEDAKAVIGSLLYDMDNPS
jgi:hypothetical protein